MGTLLQQIDGIDQAGHFHAPLAELSNATDEYHRRAVGRVIAAFDTEPDKNFSLQDMAEVAYISRFHFNRVFHKVTGVRPRVFQRAVRMQQAKQMLLQSNLRVTEVCFEVGYNSLGTFVRSFTELVGVSPLKFRFAASSLGPPDYAMLRAGNESCGAPQVRARVLVPPGFCGPILAALFSSPVAEGKPVACAFASEQNVIALSHIAPGKYYLCIAAMPAGADSSNYLLTSPNLVGRGTIQVRPGPARQEDELEIALRPVQPTDPPVVMTLAGLIPTGHDC